MNVIVRPACKLAEVVTVYAWPSYDWCEGEDLEEMLMHKSDDYVKLSVAIYTTDEFYEAVDRAVEHYFKHVVEGRP